MTETIRIEEPGRGVSVIVLNRPEKGNAFNQLMLDELHDALTRLAADPLTRVVVFRAAGKHFCTGADLAGRGEGAGGVSLGQLLACVDAFPKPVIALVQGGCVGGGLALAACCDIVLAGEAAFFSVPELRVGIAPSSELATYFMRAMGARAFRRYGLSGERIGAEEAVRLGLAHERVTDNDCAARLTGLVDDLLHSAPLATTQLKARIRRIEHGAQGHEETVEPRGLDRSPEAREGVTAYREKRKPAWYPPA